MAQPVVHFEVVGNYPARLRDYFLPAFRVELCSPLTGGSGGVCAGRVRVLDLITADFGTGVRGGVGGGSGYESRAVFYVGVPDVEAALQRAEDLGGTRIMAPVTSANGLVVGHFEYPEGTLIGVTGALRCTPPSEPRKAASCSTPKASSRAG